MVFFKFLSWPLIIDSSGKALNWIRNVHKDRGVRIIQHNSQNREVILFCGFE